MCQDDGKLQNTWMRPIPNQMFVHMLKIPFESLKFHPIPNARSMQSVVHHNQMSDSCAAYSYSRVACVASIVLLPRPLMEISSSA